MNNAGDIQITGRWSSADELAERLSVAPMVMEAVVTDRLFKLPRGHFLRRGLNGIAEPKVQAFFDDGDRHHLIEIDMPGDQDAFAELTAVFGHETATNETVPETPEPSSSTAMPEPPPAKPPRPTKSARRMMATKKSLCHASKPRRRLKLVRPDRSFKVLNVGPEIRRRVREILPGIVRAEIEAYLRRAIGRSRRPPAHNRWVPGNQSA